MEVVEPGYLDAEMGAYDIAVHVGCSRLCFTSCEAMKMTPHMIKTCAMFAGIIFMLVAFVFAIAHTVHNGNEKERVQKSLQPMKRVGSIGMDRDTVYLWEFEYDGRKCLWATRHGHLSGLDCWKEKE